MTDFIISYLLIVIIMSKLLKNREKSPDLDAIASTFCFYTTKPKEIQFMK